jgi:DUF4097 and DUF4098 domain-containing protein YvlB
MRALNPINFARQQRDPDGQSAGYPRVLRQTAALAAGLLLLFIPTLVAARGNQPDRNRTRQQVERSVAADPRVVVSACLISGNVTVRGWERNEVHARVSDGVQIEMTRTDQNTKQAARELKLTLGQTRRGRNSDCLPYGDIELDVPRGATLKLEATSGDIRITDVAQVSSVSQGGNITLTRVHGEVNVSTIGGQISVANSTGSFKLHGVGGSIDVRDLAPASGADVLEASSVGGDVSVNRVTHQRVRVATISGEMDYSGALARGGQYSFESMSGELSLSLPANSSFRLSGTIGAGGDFSNAFVKDNHVVLPPGSMRRLDDVVGTGDATIHISFFSGTVQIRKQ